MKKLLFLALTVLLTACVTAQVKYDVIIQKAAPLLYLNGTGPQLKFYSYASLTGSAGVLTLSGANLNLGTNSLLGTGSLGATGAGKLTKIWSVDAEFSNVPTINGVPMSSTYSTIASPTFTTGITTPAITLGSTLLSVTGNQLNYLNTATSDIQTQLGTKQATLVSGTNIKTVGGITLLGSGDIPIAGTGTVTSVGVTTANGVSASIANPTSAANMTFTLGAINPTSVNTVTISGSSTPTLAVTGTSTISGANTGDNVANSLYSGLVSNATHTGDVTGATALTIANSAVTLAKMANMATASLIYRKSGATGAPEVQTLATLKTDLGLTGTNSGDQTTITGNAGSATILQTARTINGISFNGSANIEIPSNIAPGTAGNVMQSTGTLWASNSTTDISTVALMKHPTITPKTASYELLLTDDGTIITMNSSSATNLTVPLNSSVAFPTGTQITIMCIGSGKTTVVATGGVTIISKGSVLGITVLGDATLVKLATNTWKLIGSLE
jgi:hypothetical protein